MARYLTTTLPYVNADPHIGFALELVHADSLVRAWRAHGEDVFFTTGTDEHGQKIFQAAEKAGQGVQEYVDHYAGQFEKLKQALSISNDAFIRTTDPKHVEAAQEQAISIRRYMPGCTASAAKRSRRKRILRMTATVHCTRISFRRKSLKRIISSSFRSTRTISLSISQSQE
jgi:leucyl-tRNA synthetase